MKKLLSIGIFFLIILNIYAQSDGLMISELKLTGKNYLTNTDIQCKEYMFPERIDNYFLDTTTNYLTVQLRGTSKNGKWLNSTGDLLLYDLVNNKIKWTKKINYQQEFIVVHNKMIIQSKGNKSYSLNIENGEDQWELKNAIYYVEPYRKIAMGYNNLSASKNADLLEGIDLSNGNPTWSRKIPKLYNWNELLHLNDSVIILAAAGLHSINIKNGTGWDYDAITGKKDYKETAITNAAGIAMGALTGTGVVATGYNLVRDVISNVLIDSSSIYLASKEKISRLGHDGQIQWTHPLPEDSTSNSEIFIKDNILYLLNKGYAFMGNRKLDFGTPFFTSFDLNSGKQIFMSAIKEKKDQVNGYIISKDTILLLFKDRVSKYSMKDGSVLSEKSFDVKTAGELRDFLGDQVYTKTDSDFKCLATSDPTKYYLYTSTKKILVTNCNLDIIDQIDADQLYIYYLKTKDLKFLAKGKETIILDNSNKIVADLKASGKAKLAGSKLFDIQEKSFIEVDLKELIRN